MIWNGETARIRMAKNDVAARLVIDFIAQPTERFDSVLPGASRQLAHVETSMISSVMG